MRVLPPSPPPPAHTHSLAACALCALCMHVSICACVRVRVSVCARVRVCVCVCGRPGYMLPSGGTGFSQSFSHPHPHQHPHSSAHLGFPPGLALPEPSYTSAPASYFAPDDAGFAGGRWQGGVGQGQGPGPLGVGGGGYPTRPGAYGLGSAPPAAVAAAAERLSIGDPREHEPVRERADAAAELAAERERRRCVPLHQLPPPPNVCL